jgi:hypothetical protein
MTMGDGLPAQVLAAADHSSWQNGVMPTAARNSVGSVRQRERRQLARMIVSGAPGRLACLLQRSAARGPVVTSAVCVAGRDEPLTVHDR